LEIHCQDSGCRSSYYRVGDSGGIDSGILGVILAGAFWGALAGG